MKKKIVLITGANKGIGYQLAKRFGKLGCIVIVSARNTELGMKAVNRLKNDNLECYFLNLDVTNEESIANAVLSVKEQFGRLDILINNAGIFLDTFKKTTELTLNEFKETLNVNLLGVFSVTKAFMPLLKKSDEARIINMSSDLGALSQASDPDSEFDIVSGPSYRVSKAALNMLTLVFARELRGSNITVNAASPGWCKTELGTDAAPKTAFEGADTPLWIAMHEDPLNGGFFCNRLRIEW